MKPSDYLQEIIDRESKGLIESFDIPSYHIIQNIVRRMDIIFSLFGKSEGVDEKKVQEFQGFFGLGWAPLLKPFYKDINLNNYQPYPLMDNGAIQITDIATIYRGKIEFCKQLIAYEKAGLIEIHKPKKNEFTFSYLHKNVDVERFDKISLDFYREKIIEQRINEDIKENPFNVNRVKSELKKIVKSPDGIRISYVTTPYIDEYYNKQGFYYILRLQGYDNFDDNDIFGSIKYKKYVDLVQLIIGVALMHTDACLELKKMNKDLNLHELLSYTYFKDKTIELYSNYLETSKEEISQIFSCITLTKENFDYYLEYPGTPPPMYFQVSNNLIIRSIAGCISNPLSILNRELKRRFKNDYDKAVNNREFRFREELYTFFLDERMIKIRKEINISINGLKTDIDAIVYDKETATLGLFQLKWQDPFFKSMIERYSRISNLFPKANEWIGKIKLWLANNSSKSIISSLKIDKEWKEASQIKEVYIFILSRNQMNFTGQDLDPDVAWSSWYQLIESQARVKTDSNNPIRAMFSKIKALEPNERVKREGALEFEDLEIIVGNNKIYYRS